jgi:hypothetical protein
MKNVQQRFFNKLVMCPNTARHVNAEQITFQGITGRMAGVDVWWRCPACGRWHIFELKPKAVEPTKDECSLALC